MTGLRETFAAPRSFANDRENAAASLLNTVLWVTIVSSTAFQAFQLLAGTDWLRITSASAVLLLSCLGLVALRRSRLHLAAWLATTTLFAISGFSMLIGGGLHAAGWVTLVILIVMSAMALERRRTVFWTAASLALLSGLAFAQSKGWLPAEPRATLVELWFISVLQLLVAAWLVSYSAGAFRGVLGALGARNLQLAESEARYAQLVEQSPDVIVALDSSGVIIECSPAIESLLGYAPSEVVGRRFDELPVIPAESQKPNLAAFQSMLAGRARKLRPAPAIHRDGSMRWVEANPRLHRPGSGSARLYLVVRDVTDRVEAESRRASLEHQLVEARRLEGLGRMAGGVAHDFNNLLLVILANLEVLESSSEPESAPLLAQIRTAGEAASELTANLLAFSGQQVQEIGHVEVGASLTKIEGLFDRLLRPNVNLDIRLADDSLVARGDPSQIEQVILNLVMNAQQAMPEGGTISIDVSRVRVGDEESQAHPGSSPGDHIRIAVSDDGIGMDEATAAHVFEPFFSKREGGTGLGMATVHGIVSQCGGHIRVHSVLGSGTKFEVLLPSTESVSSQTSTETRSSAVGESTVLLVDDEPAVLNSVSLLLEGRGFRVLCASTLEEARAASDREPGRIDVLLSDVLMPGATGPQLAADLVASRPEMKVLLMSGYTEDQLDDHEVLRSRVYFIAKPFSGDTVADKIRRVLSDSPGPSAAGLRPGSSATQENS